MSGAPGQVADASQVTAASAPAAPAGSPFTMVNGDPAAMVCEGDVCFVPGAESPA